MNEREISINKIAQGLIPLEQGMEWFQSSDEETRTEIMKTLDLCIYQSHPSKEDIEKGIVASGLKNTYSPCVLIRVKPFNEVRRKVLRMSGIDQIRSFKLFVNVFSVADERRRKEQCESGCTHDWHNL
ncbi:DUF5958 family protein [Teredinibacter franksiae]|uniref:DUF5958 family protein n=1 Tax=Teredinibacter franksiae TaxID=2761453 RepID=UPI00162912DB|nr:DUF5958 family protein [Teredinibacter franksiae]